MNIQIVTSINGVGLQNDAQIIKAILDPHHSVTITDVKGRPAKERFDLTIFLEILERRHYRNSKRKVLIPNPEWFEASWYRSELHPIGEVWTKTQHATKIFNTIKGNRDYVVRPIGFTSLNMMSVEYESELSVFHLCGRSSMKNTQAVLDTWKRYGQALPHLTVLMHDQRGLNTEAIPNATIIKKRVSDDELFRLMNVHEIHLCPSQTEGWGHYIVEAMSTGAIVLTTDTAPMNEIVTPDRGVLIPCKLQGVLRNFSRIRIQKATVTELGIFQAVTDVCDMHEQERDHLGTNAWRWYRANERKFKAKLLEVVNAD